MHKNIIVLWSAGQTTNKQEEGHNLLFIVCIAGHTRMNMCQLAHLFALHRKQNISSITFSIPYPRHACDTAHKKFKHFEHKK